MHDSDLVETLASFHPDERLRFFAHLKTADSPIQQKSYEEVAFFAHYIFKCLDQYKLSLSKPNIWIALFPKIEFHEPDLDGWEKIAVRELKDSLKKHLKRRIPVSLAELSVISSLLSEKERFEIVKLLAHADIREKANILILVDYHFDCLNKFEKYLRNINICKILFLLFLVLVLVGRS